jgi:hypothetical protein
MPLTSADEAAIGEKIMTKIPLTICATLAVALSISVSFVTLPHAFPTSATAAPSQLTPGLIENQLNPVPPGVGFPRPPLVRLLDDGRRVQLLEPFAYGDLGRRTWIVPPGYISNGASIPQALWSFGISPLVGKYRDASLLHDYMCEVRATPTSDETHLIFYEAMRVSGVDRFTAIVFWDAVSWFGPSWERAKDIRSPDCVRKAGYPAEVENLLKAMQSGAISPEQASAELQKLKGKYRNRESCRPQY